MAKTRKDFIKALSVLHTKVCTDYADYSDDLEYMMFVAFDVFEKDIDKYEKENRL